jgi:DNA-directed RNA polymerase subunit H
MDTKKTKKKEEIPIDIFKSKLVPDCKILSPEEEKEVLERYNISKQQLPRVLINDSVIKAMDAKIGNIIEFTRKRKTAGLSNFYRLVVGGASE